MGVPRNATAWLLVASVLWPSSGSAQGDPVPPGFRIHERPRYALVAVGGVTFGATYVVTAGFSLVSMLGQAGHSNERDRAFYTWNLVPAIGPWIAAAGFSGGSNSRGKTIVAITSGTLQVVGLGLVVLGTVWKRKLLVPQVALGGVTVEPRFDLQSVRLAGSW